ncbi:Calponin- (CH) domain-containing protein [Trichostrongylus colubriformis]|uniref:Calponin- (CH) domain-containing protein n=1 Tax=Trichostrongylus colubriformis TaxID=6319 RepID=A0AAN8FG48_TRICO
MVTKIASTEIFTIGAGLGTLQTTLLRLFLSFHPAWLHLGLETVFNTTINVRDDEVFIQVIIRFIMQRLFADPKILKNRKYAYGSGKLVLTERGREALNCHFLAHTALFCYFVETAKAASIIKPNPRMFTRNSAFKCLDDVFAELSREVLSGGGASLNRAFAKMGFKPTYKQGFIDDYCYSVKSFADLTNGVIIGKIVELVTGCNPGSIMGRLRNPCGDRLRKIGNVKTCLQVATEKGVDVGGIKAESVVAGSKDTLLELLWKLVGVYVSVDDERKLRRASLALTHTNGGLGVKYGAVSADAKGEQLVLHVCKQIGLHLGIEVDQLDDLRDGRVLSGESLFLKVANAAASDLDIPWGLHNSIGLFTVFYLSGLFSIREVHDAAVRIQRSYRSYRFFKTLKILLQDARSGARTSGVYDRSSLLKTYVVSPIGGGGAQISKSNTVKGEEARRALGEVQEKIELDKSMTSHEKEQHGRNIILSDSAVKIQRAFRRHQLRTRSRVQRQQRWAEYKRAATVIQRAFRRHQLRARLRVERQQRWAKYTWAATVIQRAFRRHQLRTRLRVERQQRWAEYTHAATVIQRAFRRHQLRTRLRVERQQRWAEYARAATVIQRAFRRHQLRTRLRVERQQRWAEYKRAATVIQRAFRRHQLRARLRVERQQRWAEYARAATVIQCAFRRHQLRARLRVERQQTWVEYTRAATVIQRAFRRHQLRARLRVEHQQAWVEYTRAATVIQRAFRRHQLRARLRVDRQSRWAEYTRAATVIQVRSTSLLLLTRSSQSTLPLNVSPLLKGTS